MIPRGLVETVVSTSYGPIPLWTLPGAMESRRPVVLCITGAWAEAADMTGLPAVVAPGADGMVMRLPGNGTPVLRETSVAAWGRAVEELIDGALAGRDVVLSGLSIGALVALAARSPRIRYVVAVEPPLSMAKLWPMAEGLKTYWRDRPQDREFIGSVFGIDASGEQGLRYHALFNEVTAPVDVVLGDMALWPQRTLERYPSFVDDEDRAWLAARPGVAVHVAPGAGHNIHVFSPQTLIDRLNAALRHVAERRARLEALVAATPLTARRVAYRGPWAEDWTAAYLARNPAADVLTTSPGADAVVIDDPAPAVGDIDDGAWLIGTFDDATVAGLGLTSFGRNDAGVWRGRKGAGAELLQVETIAFAPTLMDIRTRLPAEAMASEPELIVHCNRAPSGLPAAPYDRPKVVVLQRPAAGGADEWLPSLARVVAEGWLAVMEYDDHPDLVAQMTRDAAGDDAWPRFGYPHGVQTTTPELAAVFGRFNPEVAVFPNAVFDLAPFVERSGPVRVFYGGVTRGPFAAEVAAALAPALTGHPDVAFEVIGDRAVFEALPTTNKRFHDYLGFSAYLDLMARCEISLSPLKARPMIETKSDAKFLDASRAGVLTIASPTVYASVIRHGETGLIAEDLADWPRLLGEALADPAWRRGMARKAWEYVRDNRMFAAQVGARKAWYRDLWSRREALNRRVYEQLPGLEAAVATLRG